MNKNNLKDIDLEVELYLCCVHVFLGICHTAYSAVMKQYFKSLCNHPQFKGILTTIWTYRLLMHLVNINEEIQNLMVKLFNNNITAMPYEDMQLGFLMGYINSANVGQLCSIYCGSWCFPPSTMYLWRK